MKYILITLLCVCLAIFVQAGSLEGGNIQNSSHLLCEARSAPPLEKKVKKKQRKRTKIKKKQQFRKHKNQTTSSRKKKRRTATWLIIAGILAGILSIVLVILLTPTVGVPTTGILMGVATSVGWLSFAMCSVASLICIWVGIVLFNNIPKVGAPLTPTEQLEKEASERYPNLPPQKKDEYLALKQEISKLEKAEEGRKTGSEETIASLEAKKEKLTFLDKLNEELANVPSLNKMEYIFVKEEIKILEKKKKRLQQSNDDDAKATIKRIEVRIEDKLDELNALKR